jgi:hypothetical protein
LLFSLEPFSKVTEETVLNSLAIVNDPKLSQIVAGYEKYTKALATQLDEELIATDLSSAKASFYALVYEHINK